MQWPTLDDRQPDMRGQLAAELRRIGSEYLRLAQLAGTSHLPPNRLTYAVVIADMADADVLESGLEREGADGAAFGWN